jgi:DNA modification methylase
LKIEWIETEMPLKALKEYGRNPRRMSKDQFGSLVKSIKEDGYHQRLIVNQDGTIIGGHQRKKALKEAGYESVDKIPVLMPNRQLNEEEFKRLNVRDNLPFGEFDFDMLTSDFDIDELKEWGMPENWLPEIEELPTEGLTDDDAIPDTPLAPKTTPGDIYRLGNHRLMCGDSTCIDSVDKLMCGANPIVMVTDPPYGVNYHPEWREGADLGIGIGKRSKGKVINDDIFDWTEAYALFGGDVAYVWHSGKVTHHVAKNLEDCGFDIINQIIWVKQKFALSRGDYHWQHETCWYVVRKNRPHNWQGARDQATTWEIKNNSSFHKSEKEETTYGHGTQKPIECMLRPIKNNSSENDGIYDPFGGSGSTLIACEKTNRKCFMMEISPHYCDVIVKRWEDFTGKKAELVNEIL